MQLPSPFKNLTKFEKGCFLISHTLLAIFLIIAAVVLAEQARTSEAHPSTNVETNELKKFPAVTIAVIDLISVGQTTRSCSSVAWPEWSDFSFITASAGQVGKDKYTAYLVRPRIKDVWRRSWNVSKCKQIRASVFDLPYNFVNRVYDETYPTPVNECLHMSIEGKTNAQKFWGEWAPCTQEKHEFVLNTNNWSTCCIPNSTFHCHPSCNDVNDARLMKSSAWPQQPFFFLVMSQNDKQKNTEKITNVITKWKKGNQKNNNITKPSVPFIAGLVNLLQSAFEVGVWLEVNETQLVEDQGVRVSSYRCEGRGCKDPDAVGIKSQVGSVGHTFAPDEGTRHCNVIPVLNGHPCHTTRIVPLNTENVYVYAVQVTYTDALSQVLSYFNTGHSIIQFLFPTVLTMGFMFQYGDFKRENQKAHREMFCDSENTSPTQLLDSGTVSQIQLMDAQYLMK